MTPAVTFHELAEAELNEAAEYYESEVSGLGEALIAEVERSVELIRTHTEACPRILQCVLRNILRKFPYCVLYSFVGNQIRILAIASQKRRPFYWSRRR